MKIENTMTIKLTDEEVESVVNTWQLLRGLYARLCKDNIVALENVDTGETILDDELLLMMGALESLSTECSTWNMEEKA